MSKRIQENIAAFLLLFFFIAIIIMSLDFVPRARMVPIPIAAVSAVIIILQIYIMNFKKDLNLNVDATELLTRGKSKESIKEGIAKEEIAEIKIEKVKTGTEAGGILILFTYLGLAMLIGMLPAIFFFVLGFLIFITKMNWIKSIILSVITEVVVYIFFVTLLEIRFYKGWLINLFLG